MRADTELEAALGRRQLLKALAAAGLGAGVLAGAGWIVTKRSANLFEVRHERTLMQTSVAVNCLADDIDAARAAIAQAYARMADTVAVLSRFDARSAVSRLNRDGVLRQPPRQLREVLGHALRFAQLTGGAFDPTVLPVLDYVESLPEPVVLNAHDRAGIARRHGLVDYRHIELDAAAVRLRRPGMAITLDGIAKGYVVDQGIAALKAAGIEYGLIDAGGDLQAFSGADPTRHWNVGIVDPRNIERVAEVVQLRNAALSTSGNYRVFFSSDRRLFHILNPRSGYSPQAYSSVTVMAEKSVVADGMSTGSFSLPLHDLGELMARQGHAWLVFSRDGRQRWRSRTLPLIAGRAEVA